MAPKAPTPAAMRDVNERYGFKHDDDEIEVFHELAKTMMATYGRLDELTAPALPVKYPRTSGHRPEPEDNPLGAWYWKSEVQGAPEGPLAGRSVVLKDTISLAGVPMMNGCAALEGFVPDEDATVVT